MEGALATFMLGACIWTLRYLLPKAILLERAEPRSAVADN